MIRRRSFAAVIPALALAGCGFELRRAPDFAFGKIFVNAAPASQLGRDIKRAIASGNNVAVVTDPTKADVILDLLTDQREKQVVGLNATGQVREFQLRIRCRFRLRTREGRELIPDAEILQQRDISFTESAALAKEDEEQLLYRDMQADIVLQLLRRIAAVKTI